MSLTTWWQGVKAEWAANKERKRLYRELRDAIRSQDTDAVKSELEKGANPNFRPGLNSAHAMTTCIFHGNAEIYQMLLEYGANPALRIHHTMMEVGYSEKTQLSVAIGAGNAGVAKILAAHPKIDVEDGGYHYSARLKKREYYEKPLERARGRTDMEEVYAILAERRAENIRSQADKLEQDAREIKQRKSHPAP